MLFRSPDPAEPVYECHGTIWSGSLFKVESVREVGLPSVDYVLDWGEYAYGYEGFRRGYRSFMHQGSVIRHNIGAEASLGFRAYKLGPFTIRLIELAPIRCYYVTRNPLYFWLYVYHVRNARILLPRVFKILALTLNFLVRPISHGAHLRACLRGIWDGLRKNLKARY